MGRTPRCRWGRHSIDTRHLLLRHPTRFDLPIAVAAASDRVAQDWLRWLPEQTFPDGRRQAHLLAQPAGRGPYVPAPDSRLVAIDRATRRIAGLISVGPGNNGDETGGWLAPEFRGRGYGGELFGAAAALCHQHLGRPTLLAATHRTNRACAGALRAAGFVPADGPAEYLLADGTIAQPQWFRHDGEQAARCRITAELPLRQPARA